MMYCIPAVLTGAIAYLFFKEYTNNENKRRHYILHKSLQKEILPVKLQAYERLTLFLERMAPNNLLIRIQPISQRKENYEQLLIQNIEQEFDLVNICSEGVVHHRVKMANQEISNHIANVRRNQAALVGTKFLLNHFP